MMNLLVNTEKLPILDALIYAALGFAFVFIGIALLILIITVMGAIMKRRGEKKKAAQKAKAVKPVPVPVPSESEEEEVSDEVKAAIVAAIMAFYETEKPYSGFTVKRIKRIG